MRIKCCRCDMCVRSRLASIKLAKLAAGDRKFWEAILDLLSNVELDRDHYAAIIDGTWPDADEIITNARRKAAA